MIGVTTESHGLAALSSWHRQASPSPAVPQRTHSNGLPKSSFSVVLNGVIVFAVPPITRTRRWLRGPCKNLR
ncbi:hypothetical protein ARTHRO9AX_190065 [Arthrobacter sp. 9AX]|nr:hypothetical protein ARTHRO9AX_190065 [Arthrobacter sp. 9AX]